MNPVRKRKLTLILAGFFVLATVSALILYALRQNISLFYTPTQLVHAKLSANQVIRIGGMVVKGSLVHLHHDLDVEFKLTDFKATIQVHYAGILPDLFREGQGIVAIGQLIDAQHFKAIDVLAKHDEKYMPPGVDNSIIMAKNQ
ncbi:MAG: cytochrome c biogenesis protein CcmE [Legionellales bacterium RIFCSPHIGHO2_12_FULL_42_9]|nr:MAG: cytochrome c biogenesis protein CcmE [Legionellales bacterium RIFCSPHIGHO2_12_FULL_42_9]